METLGKYWIHIKIASVSKNKPLAELELSSNRESRTVISDGDRIREIKESEVLFAMFEPGVLGQNIARFEGIDTAVVSFFSPASNQMALKKLLDAMQLITVTVNVNWMPLWSFKITKENFDSETEVGDQHAVIFLSTLPLNAKNIVEQYEGLFQEEAERQEEAEKN